MAQKEVKKMTDSLIKVFVVTSLAVFPLGYAIGNSADSATDTAYEAAEQSHESAATAHNHQSQEIVDVDNAPEISDLMVTKDNKSGWNVSFTTSNFRFAPENASSAHNEGEGHAHIYVDGEKITRLYSDNYYLGELNEGSHTVRVSLNTNDHKELTLDGSAVEATAVIEDDHHAADDEESTDHSH